MGTRMLLAGQGLYSTYPWQSVWAQSRLLEVVSVNLLGNSVGVAVGLTVGLMTCYYGVSIVVVVVN